jgi:hypothetical protein
MTDTIKVSDHPEIQSALEMHPGSKYLVLVRDDVNQVNAAVAQELQRYFKKLRIEAVVVLVEAGATVKVFDLS